MNSSAIRMLRDLEPAIRAGRLASLQKGPGGGGAFHRTLTSEAARFRDGGTDVVELAGRIGLSDEEVKQIANARDGSNDGAIGRHGLFGGPFSRRARFHALIERIASNLGIETDELMKRVRQGWQERRANDVEVKSWRHQPQSPQPEDASPAKPEASPGIDAAPVSDAESSAIPAPAGTPAAANGSTPPVASSPPVLPAPAPAGLESVQVTGQMIMLDNQSNREIRGVTLNGVDSGIMVNNQQHSANVLVDGFRALNVGSYGMYLGDVSNWTIQNTTLTQGSGAYQHGLRVASGDDFTVRNTTIDTSAGGKSSIWFIDVDRALVENSTIIGGAIRIGARPNDGQGSPTPSDITIRDSVIRKVSGGDQHAIHIWPGSDNVHLENLDITITTSDRWLYIDPRNTGNITWKNIRVNGVLIQDFQGVELDGVSQDEARARGIGAVA